MKRLVRLAAAGSGAAAAFAATSAAAGVGIGAAYTFFAAFFLPVNIQSCNNYDNRHDCNNYKVFHQRTPFIL